MPASPTRATSATKNGPSSPPTGRWCAKTRRGAGMTCARSSTPRAGSGTPALPGAGCRTTCHPGTPSTPSPRRWLHAGVFAALVADRRTLLRVAAGRRGQPSAAIVVARALQSTPESGARAGDDGGDGRHCAHRREQLECRVGPIPHDHELPMRLLQRCTRRMSWRAHSVSGLKRRCRRWA